MTPDENKQILLDLARKNKRKFAFWNFLQPNTDRSYEDLIEAINSGELTLNKVPTGQWESFKKYNMGEHYNPNVMGYMTGDRRNINVPSDATDETLMHEMLHFFSSHKNVNNPERPGGYGTSEYNTLGERYRRLDRDKAKGWLPSLHPLAPRPELPGKNPLSLAWNKYLASTESSRKLDKKMGYGTLSGSRQVDVMSGDYDSDYGDHSGHGDGYRPPSNLPGFTPPAVSEPETSPTISDFGSAFKKARESGLKEFDYKGKKYHTRLKEEGLVSQKMEPEVIPMENNGIDFLNNLIFNTEEAKVDATKTFIKGNY